MIILMDGTKTYTLGPSISCMTQISICVTLSFCRYGISKSAKKLRDKGSHFCFCPLQCIPRPQPGKTLLTVLSTGKPMPPVPSLSPWESNYPSSQALDFQASFQSWDSVTREWAWGRSTGSRSPKVGHHCSIARWFFLFSFLVDLPAAFQKGLFPNFFFQGTFN